MIECCAAGVDVAAAFGGVVETLDVQLGDRRLQIVIERYRREITDLFGHLSQSSSRVTASEGVHALVACYRDQFPGAFTNLPERYEDMPYRQALQGIHAKLGATSDEAEHRYRSPDEFLADLEGDPAEKYNVADKFPEKTAELQALIGRLQTEMDTEKRAPFRPGE